MKPRVNPFTVLFVVLVGLIILSTIRNLSPTPVVSPTAASAVDDMPLPYGWLEIDATLLSVFIDQGQIRRDDFPQPLPPTAKCFSVTDFIDNHSELEYAFIQSGNDFRFLFRRPDGSLASADIDYCDTITDVIGIIWYEFGAGWPSPYGS